MKSFLINVVGATIWLLFSPSPSAVGFLVGFLICFGLMALFSAVFQSRDYVRRSVALGRFIIVFLWEFLKANVAVTWTVLFASRDSIHPNFVTLDVAGMTPGEILILSYSITLTPGTTSVDIEDDFKTLIIHALDADRPDEVREQINRSLKNAVLGFTR